MSDVTYMARECGVMWGVCSITGYEHQCDELLKNDGTHDDDHHCGYCGEESPNDLEV